MKNSYLSFIIALVSLLLSSCGSYSKQMTKILKNSLGEDFRNYYAFSYPTNNFGILTTFENTLSPENQLCAMLNCFDTLKPEDESERLTLMNLADIGEGAPISISKSVQAGISVDAVLPKLWGSLDAGAEFDKKNIKNVNLSMGKAYVRHLNRIRFNDLMNGLPASNLYKQKFLSGNLIIAISDVVVTSLEATVELSDSMKVALEAKFSPGASDTNFSGIDLNGQVSRIENAKYTFKISQPVFVLRLCKKQPQAGTLRSDESFDGWITVKDYISPDL